MCWKAAVVELKYFVYELQFIGAKIFQIHILTALYQWDVKCQITSLCVYLSLLGSWCKSKRLYISKYIHKYTSWKMSSVYTYFYLGEFTDVHQGLYFCIIQDLVTLRTVSVHICRMPWKHAGTYQLFLSVQAIDFHPKVGWASLL